MLTQTDNTGTLNSLLAGVVAAAVASKLAKKGKKAKSLAGPSAAVPFAIEL